MNFKVAINQSVRALGRALPLIFGVILLTGLVQAFLPAQVLAAFFHHNVLVDSCMGSVLGSILVGSPITSYVLGGEFLQNGVSLTAVTAFIVSWVTVGVVQFPAEATMLGKRFAVLRNSTSFVFSMIVAVLTSALLPVLL